MPKQPKPPKLAINRVNGLNPVGYPYSGHGTPWGEDAANYDPRSGIAIYPPGKNGPEHWNRGAF